MATLTLSDGTILQISKEIEEELREEFGPRPKPKFGDIVTSVCGRRVVLWNSCGVLWAFGKNGRPVGSVDGFYAPTGDNIFTADSFDFDD